MTLPHRLNIFAVFLAAGIACLPLLAGFPHGHDFLYELPRIAEYRNALVAGQWPPFWASNLYGGFGSPIFLYYSPLFMFVATLLSLPFDSVMWGATLALVLFTLLSAWLVMGMVRSAFDGDDAAVSFGARVAAYLYVLSPYLIGDKLLRNANAEFTALCVAPLAFWGLFLIRREPVRGGLLLASGLALTVLAHNLTALWVYALLGVGMLALYFPARHPRAFAHALGGGVLGLALSAFLWLPALVLKSEIQVEHLALGRLDFHQLFAPLERVFSYAGYSVGWLPPTVLLLALVFAVKNTTDPQLRRVLAATVLIGIAFVLLQTRISVRLWEALPWLPLFQFPWRMMGPLALLVAFAGAAITLSALARWTSLNTRWLEVSILALCVANAIPNLLRYEAVAPERAALVQPGLTPAAIRASPFTTTVYDEYLPRGANPAAWQPPRADRGPVLSSEPPARWEVVRDASTQVEIKITTEQPTTLHLARWLYPVWNVTINGVPAQSVISAWRTLDIAVPAGVSTVALTLTQPGIRTVGLWISLAGFALWLLLVSRLRRTRVDVDSTEQSGIP